METNNRGETNLAVLIDFENIAAGTEKEGLGRFDVETLMKRLKDKGRILIARSYADWGRFYRFKQTLLAENVTMMELTSHGQQDKNRADIALVVDALELAFTKDYIDAFVVVSGDSDFTPMVLKMRELNKRVIGVGTRKSTSRLLFQACDEFLYYDTIVQPKTRAQPTPRGKAVTGELAKAFELLVEALEGLQREVPDPPHGSLVKSAMLRKSPIFSESDLGFPTLARFLEAARDHGVIRLVRDTKSGGYRVDSIDGGEERDGSRDAGRDGGRERDGRDRDGRDRDGRDRDGRDRDGRDRDRDRDEADEPTSEVPVPSSFADQYLPAGSATFVDVLSAAGHHPLSAPTRLAILEALTDVMRERAERRRKNTLPFVIDDMKKKLRRLDLPQDQIKGVLDTLLAAGELIHRDGTAIRSGTRAAFVIHKDSTQLNDSMVRFYLAHLRDAGCDLSDTALLADLFLGSADRRREIETTLAYLSADQFSSDSPDGNDLDLDDLLTVGGGGRPAAPRQAELQALPDDLDAVLEAAAPARPAARRAEAELPPEPVADLLDLDAVLESSGEPRIAVSEPDGEPKKRKRTRTKSDKPSDKPEKEAKPAAAKAEPRERKSTRKAAPAPAELTDLDSLLEPVDE